MNQNTFSETEKNMNCADNDAWNQRQYEESSVSDTIASFSIRNRKNEGRCIAVKIQ